jgi:hypothetical protein
MEIEKTLHQQPLPNPHHRKIELQSAQDLVYLQSNLIASARQKLDLHFPPAAAQPSKKPQPATIISLDGVKPPSLDAQTTQRQAAQNGDQKDEVEEDPMRSSVRAYVDAYISRIYTAASPSITVNGLDATSLAPTILSTKHPFPMPLSNALETQTGPCEEKEGVDFIYEVHDTRLQKKVADMYAELEALTVQVGQLRRTAPGQGAKELGQRLAESMESEDAEFDREMAALKQEAAGQGGKEGSALQLQALSDEWFADRKEMYEHGMRDLTALVGAASEETMASAAQRGPSLTETVGRVQRARTVALEFE